MRYYKPVLKLSESLPPKTDYADQLGGLPWGFPLEKWPNCANCGSPLTLIAQFQHHQERLPLGKTGRVLYLFQCEALKNDCPTYEPDSGANAVIILNPEEQTHAPLDKHPESLTILPEARVDHWVVQDDGISHNQLDQFFDYQKWIQFGETEPESVELCTRLGGPPGWIQLPEPVEPPYYFAGQIDHYLEITPSPSHPFTVEQDEHYRFIRISSPTNEEGDEPLFCDFANFGDSGMGYLFVNPAPDKPTGYFLWQCY